LLQKLLLKIGKNDKFHKFHICERTIFSFFSKKIAPDNIIPKNIYLLQITSRTYDTSDRYNLDIPYLHPGYNLFISGISQNHPQSGRSTSGIFRGNLELQDFVAGAVFGEFEG